MTEVLLLSPWFSCKPKLVLTSLIAGHSSAAHTLKQRKLQGRQDNMQILEALREPICKMANLNHWNCRNREGRICIRPEYSHCEGCGACSICTHIGHLPKPQDEQLSNGLQALVFECHLLPLPQQGLHDNKPFPSTCLRCNDVMAL